MSTYAAILVLSRMYYFDKFPLRPFIFSPTAGGQGRFKGKGTGSPKLIDAGRPGGRPPGS